MYSVLIERRQPSNAVVAVTCRKSRPMLSLRHVVYLDGRLDIWHLGISPPHNLLCTPDWLMNCQIVSYWFWKSWRSGWLAELLSRLKLISSRILYTWTIGCTASKGLEIGLRSQATLWSPTWHSRAHWFSILLCPEEWIAMSSRLQRSKTQVVPVETIHMAIRFCWFRPKSTSPALSPASSSCPGERDGSKPGYMTENQRASSIVDRLLF